MKRTERRKLMGARYCNGVSNPMTSLNPFYMVYQKLREVFRTHCNPRDAYRDEVLALLKKMELPNPETVMGRSPLVMPMRSKNCSAFF